MISPRSPYTMIQCSTLCTQRKVTKFPCFWCLVFGAQFQHFLEFFLPSFFAMQLALVSMITVTFISSLSVFFMQRTRRFLRIPAETKGAPAETKGYTLRCSGDLLCGYLRGCRGEEEKPELERVDRLPVSAGNFRRALHGQRYFLVDFQTEDIAGKIFSCSKRAYFALVNRARNG